VAAARTRLDLGRAHLGERELGGHEEAVEQDQQQADDQADAWVEPRLAGEAGRDRQERERDHPAVEYRCQDRRRPPGGSRKRIGGGFAMQQVDRFVRAAAIAALVAVAAVPALWATTQGRVHGTVTDETGKPVAD